MKKKLFSLFSFLTIIALVTIITIPVSANENSYNVVKKEVGNIIAEAYLADENGGKLDTKIITEINLEIDTRSTDFQSYNRIDGIGVEYTASVKVVLEIPDDSVIATQGEVGSSEGNNVIASLNIVYTWYPSATKIKVTKIYGDWRVTNNVYNVENRFVDAFTDSYHSPFPKYPTSNSFSYNTGWGQEIWYNPTAISGAKAYTTAWITVPGMSGGEYEAFISCEVATPWN